MRLYPLDSRFVCVCVRVCIILWRVPMTTVLGRGLGGKPSSAVIASPKSFVIALICIVQLSVLAHSKNNQPPLKTGGRYNYYISGLRQTRH